MRPFFKPLPGLTFITLILLSVLLWLGTWQYQRLGWKTVLLAEIDAAANSAPLTSMAQIRDALADGSPLDFRRFEIDARSIPFETPLRVYTPREMDFGWRLFSPIESEGSKVFAALNIIGDGDEPVTQPVSGMIAGYVRIARDGKHRTKSTPEQNRWFGFNPMPETHDWGAKVPDLDTRYYLDVVSEINTGADLPVKTPEIRNNHFEYMLTWYSLALILLVYYLLIHRREGRVGWS